MSYYQKSSLIITDHAIVRAQQRIRECKGLDHFATKIKLIEIIQKFHQPDFQDRNYSYFHLSNQADKYLYIVIKKYQDIVTTVTPISHAKKIQLLSKS